MNDQKATALRKRQKIAKASRVMFLWVAGASVIVGASTVMLFVIGQKMVFNEKILAKKQDTISTLDNNNGIVEDLENNVRVLNTNQSLIDLQTPADSEPIQVIFDALPSKANAEALGSALNHKELLGAPGIRVESMNVESSDKGSSSDSSQKGSISFSFTVSSDDANDLRDLLSRMSRSIRALKISKTSIESGSTFKMTVEGDAYYQPAKKVEAIDKEVQP